MPPFVEPRRGVALQRGLPRKRVIDSCFVKFIGIPIFGINFPNFIGNLACIISGGGWSYTPDASYMSGRDAVHMLIDIVAKGGNLLLNVAPGPDGNWQQGAYDLLDQISNWMDVNQEAIYDSNPIMPYKEDNICMTRQPEGTVHYFYLAGPDERLPETISIRSHKPLPGAAVSLLGTDEELDWEVKEYGFEIHVPEELRNNPPCRYAWTFEVSGIENDL